MAEIMGGVRSMMTYIGAAHLKEVSKRTTFVRVTAQTNDVFGGERAERKAAALAQCSTLRAPRISSSFDRRSAPLRLRPQPAPGRRDRQARGRAFGSGAKRAGQPRLSSVERNDRQLQRFDQAVDVASSTPASQSLATTSE